MSNLESWHIKKLPFMQHRMPMRFVTMAVVSCGQFCGSIVAIAAVMYVPVKTLMGVQELKQSSKELQQSSKELNLMMSEILARIEKMQAEG